MNFYIRRGLAISFGLLVVLIIASALWLYRPMPENPSAELLRAAASNYRAEVIRDTWGVPHIYGQRDADVSFGLAYAHAEDDFETIQEVVAATRGVLASYRGKVSAPTDYIVHLLDVWPTVEDNYEKLPADVKAIAEGYATGLNLYASDHPNSTWRGLAPFKAEDVVAGFVFKTPFFYGLDDVLLKLFSEERVIDLAIDPAPTETAFQLRQRRGGEIGSNAIAVSADRSGEGITRLLINSHQPMTGPVAWYEAQLESQESLQITGGLFPGTPLILHGFNRHVGWANTVNHIDLSDVYIIQRNPDNQSQYRLDQEWLEFEVADVIIEVKLFGPFRFPAKRRVLRSRHGPIIEGKNNTYALRFAGMGEYRQLEQYYRLNQAQNLRDFLSALAMNALPSINYVYADKDDNLAFIHNAQYPNRDDAWNWQRDLPGNRTDLIWQGYRPYSQVPKLVNPESGLIFNANNTPFSATDGADNLKSVDFPQSMGLATNETNRSLRLMELTDGESRIDKKALLALKFDDRYADASTQVALLTAIVAIDADGDVQLQSAIEHLKKWDRRTNKDNPHAALAVLTLRHILRGDAPEDHSEPALKKALRATIDYLMTNFARLDIAWGEVNRLVRGDVNLPLDGGPDILRAIYSFGLAADVIPHATHGDTWMAVVEWDENGKQSADVLHQFGSATLDSTSPHFNDQAPLFAKQQWRKAWLTRSEVERHASRRYWLGQE